MEALLHRVGRDVEQVGDVGDREEIVVSADARKAAGAVRFPVSEARSVSLKGVKNDVAVHTVDWR